MDIRRLLMLEAGGAASESFSDLSRGLLKRSQTDSPSTFRLRVELFVGMSEAFGAGRWGVASALPCRDCRTRFAPVSMGITRVVYVKTEVYRQVRTKVTVVWALMETE